MQQKLDEIKEKTMGNVKTMYVVADFATMQTYEEYERAMAQLKTIDIAILFLNAGIGQVGAFAEASTTRMERLLQVNVQHPTFICRAVLSQLLEREQRSAIVVTSSGLGKIPVAGTIVYAASKAFASSFAQGLSYEVEDKIDVIDWAAGEVKTKLLGKNMDNPRAEPTDIAV